MTTQKRNRILYWAVTLIVLLPTAVSAIPELFAGGLKATVAQYQALGYPLYLMKILGFSKILGAIVLLMNRRRAWTEWAYAGFGILFLGATASHVLSGDLGHAPIPFAFFILLAGSYALWSRNQEARGDHNNVESARSK
jgi:hypothetical protein